MALFDVPERQKLAHQHEGREPFSGEGLGRGSVFRWLAHLPDVWQPHKKSAKVVHRAWPTPGSTEQSADEIRQWVGGR
jgi:hypothetical protein